MKVATSKARATELDTDALVLAVTEDAEKPTPWEDVDDAAGGIIAGALTGPGFFGKRGTSLALSASGAAKEIVLVGLGKSSELDVDGWRRAVASGFTTARRRGNKRIAVPLPEIDGIEVDALAAGAAEAAILADYRYDEYKSVPAERVVVEEMTIAAGPDVGPAVSRAQTIAEATCWARDLVNTPSNEKRPAALAERALPRWPPPVDSAAAEVIDDDKRPRARTQSTPGRRRRLGGGPAPGHPRAPPRRSGGPSRRSSSARESRSTPVASR